MSVDKSKRCKRCHRPLKTEMAQLSGYGPICYQKVKSAKLHKQYRMLDLFELKDK